MADISQLQSDIETLRNSHPEWFAEQTSDDGVLYCLPGQEYGAALALFTLPAETIDLETRLNQAFEASSAIAYCDGRPISHPCFQPHQTVSAIPEEQVAKLGWEKKHFAALNRVDKLTNTVHHRMRASVGRLLVRPDFRTACDKLHAMWLSLPVHDRPGLPLVKPSAFQRSSIDSMNHKDSRAATEAVASFWFQFADFCEHWELDGMATWELPLPLGPVQSRPQVISTGPLQVFDVSRYPWHYPLLNVDNVGDVAQKNHLARAIERGVADHNHWETYARICSIVHWEFVLTSRYPAQLRIKTFISRLTELLADICEISVDRAALIRKQAASLRSGRKRQLKSRAG